MALSYYSNWGSLQHLTSEMSVFPQTQPELLGFFDNFALSDTCIDPIFEPHDLFYSENCTHHLPYFSSPSDENFNFLTPETIPPPEFQPYHYPKRPKTYENNYCSDLYPGLFNGFVPNPQMLPELSPELFVPLPEFESSPPVYDCGSVVESEKKANGGSLSAQSIAARHRRRKITEKTQELGKLIPGGHKMNTAEMFQSASKYIKFLQAQVGILQLMGSIQENEEEFHSQELQALVTSPLIQEKLYSSEKCLVPKQFFETLEKDGKLKSNPLILKDINELIRTTG